VLEIVLHEREATKETDAAARSSLQSSAAATRPRAENGSLAEIQGSFGDTGLFCTNIELCCGDTGLFGET